MSVSDEDKDFYAVLGAREDAPADEIPRRSRRLTARHHADRGGDEEEMKALNEAHGVLGDEAGREANSPSRPARVSVKNPMSDTFFPAGLKSRRRKG